MVLRVVEINRDGGDGFSSWYSLIYCVMFSMAIPVVYKSNMENPTLFHAVEIVVSLVLVFAFTYMLRSMFVSKEVNLLSMKANAVVDFTVRNVLVTQLTRLVLTVM